ncbi:hypothetical protein TI04_08815 [Achromatium sp. WMS2]|nr:hypothetical protein TI04_08815 [Achromatium sp. WMS2]
MFKLLITLSLLMSLASFNLMANTAANSGAHAITPDAETNQNLAIVGGGLVGLLVASGAAGLISSSVMMLEGAGVAEAIEAGAGLTMPVAVLSAILGGMFAQEFVLRTIESLRSGGHKPAVAAH